MQYVEACGAQNGGKRIGIAALRHAEGGVVDGTHAPAPGEVEMTACALAFCREVERGGYDAGVYFNQSFGYRYLDLAELQDYALWLAEYGDAPTFRYRFDCLQYTDSGSVAGIEVAVDMDILLLED